jgi:hypothetical protein
MKTKTYKITFCLEAGYSGTGKKFSLEEAQAVIKEWMSIRLTKNLLVANGVLANGTIFFPAKGRRADGDTVTVGEAGVYEGNIFYDETEPDEEAVKEVLNSLAFTLKENLQQDRIYIIYESESWYL